LNLLYDRPVPLAISILKPIFRFAAPTNKIRKRWASSSSTCTTTASQTPSWRSWPGNARQGILKGGASLYHWPPVWLVWNQLYDNWQFLYLFAKQTNPNSQIGGQWYSDTSSFSVPWYEILIFIKMKKKSKCLV